MEDEKINKALGYAMNYCARGEHTESEVRRKLKRFELSDEETNHIIQELLSEGFIDPGRFARLFCQEKFTLNQWGKIKIRKALKQKGIDEAVINTVLKEIDPEAYEQLLKKHLGAKLKSIKDRNTFIRKGKLFRYAAQKGFEPDLIYRIIDEVMDENSEA